MKIVLVVPEFPKLSESFIVNKFLGLLDRGWDVHVLCQRTKKQEWNHFSQFSDAWDLTSRVHLSFPIQPRWLVTVLLPISLFLGILFFPRRVIRYLRALSRFGIDERLRRFYVDAPLIRLNPSVLHFEFGTLAVGRMYLRKALGCRIVVSFRGFDISYAGLEDPNYYRDVWTEADCLHFLGEDLLSRARNRGYVDGSNHVLIPASIDHIFFDPGRKEHRDVCGSRDRPLRILSVGRLEWKKGYEFAIEAVSRILSRGCAVEYEIIGDGAFFEGLAFACRQFGIADNVRFLGSLPRETVRDKMLWADVFLHAAVSEGFCNAVLEAQSMMLPIVSSDADGLRENIADGESGFVVSRRSGDQLADKLILLAADPARRMEMGRQGRRRVQDLFCLTKQVNENHRLYSKFVNPAGLT
jgi:colanic acid/amylovoran biosynthesis glycosyltransferase